MDDGIRKNYEKKVGERKRICYIKFKDKKMVSLTLKSNLWFSHSFWLLSKYFLTVYRSLFSAFILGV